MKKPYKAPKMMSENLTGLNDWFSLKDLIRQMRRAMKEGRDRLFAIEKPLPPDDK